MTQCPGLEFEINFLIMSVTRSQVCLRIARAPEASTVRLVKDGGKNRQDGGS